MENVVNEFREYTDKMYALSCAQSTIYWDMTTGASKGATAQRAKTLGILSGEAFSMLLSEKMQNMLDELSQNEADLDEVTLDLYKLYKKEYSKLKNIPVNEFREYQEMSANSEAAWEEAKHKSDFDMFAPFLEKQIATNRKFIDYRGYNGHPYNTLLDDYEPDLTVEMLDEFFAKIKDGIVPLLKKVTASSKKIRTDFLSRTVPIPVQKQISDYLLNLIGFDFNRGMIKESEHPFTTGMGQNDIRVTTHYYENNFLSSLFSVLHEGGHALYEQNVNPKYIYTALDGGTSLGIHESQSRFYENVVGRSLEFWELIYDKLQEICGDIFKDVTALEFYEAANIAKPSLIRVEADELTYSLHVMIRYEIEKILFDKSTDVKDLPKIWNQKVKDYLGLTPPDDAHGVLQDVHWSAGLLGYFPSYSLGNAYASQFQDIMMKQIDLPEFIKTGNFIGIKEWLRVNIHQYGSAATPSEIIQKITGKGLSPEYYINYLEQKFGKLYL